MTTRGETLTRERDLDRYLVDAIRDVLGMRPLYTATEDWKHKADTRFLAHTYAVERCRARKPKSIPHYDRGRGEGR